MNHKSDMAILFLYYTRLVSCWAQIHYHLQINTFTRCLKSDHQKVRKVERDFINIFNNDLYLRAVHIENGCFWHWKCWQFYTLNLPRKYVLWFGDCWWQIYSKTKLSFKIFIFSWCCITHLPWCPMYQCQNSRRLRFYVNYSHLF